MSAPTNGLVGRCISCVWSVLRLRRQRVASLHLPKPLKWAGADLCHAWERGRVVSSTSHLRYEMEYCIRRVKRSVSGVSQAWQGPCPTFRPSIQTFRRHLGSKTVARAKRRMFRFLTKTSSAASFLWADAEEVMCTSSDSAADLNRPSRTCALE